MASVSVLSCFSFLSMMVHSHNKHYPHHRLYCTLSAPVYTDLGVSDQWKMNSDAVNGDEGVVIASGMNSSNRRKCVAVRMAGGKIVLIEWIGIAIMKPAAADGEAKELVSGEAKEAHREAEDEIDENAKACSVNVVDMTCTGFFTGAVRRLDVNEAAEMAANRRDEKAAAEDGGAEQKRDGGGGRGGGGGDNVAAAAAAAAAHHVEAEELVCAKCAVANVQTCDKHGTDWIQFKCRYCCSLATFFCWKKVHFCSACHNGIWRDLVEYNKGVNKLKPPAGKYTEKAYDPKKIKQYTEYLTCPAAISGNAKDCPLGIIHAPNGEEFGMGCSMCQDQRNM